MEIHLVMTLEMEATLPDDVKIPKWWGDIELVKDSDSGVGEPTDEFSMIFTLGEETINGLSCLVSGPKESLHKWLLPFGEVAINTSPDRELFELVKIKDAEFGEAKPEIVKTDFEEIS